MTLARSLQAGAAVLILSGVAGLAVSTPAAAQAQGTLAQRQACEADAFKFCSEFIPFVHQIENCLFRNMRNLTPACQYEMRGGNAAASRSPRR